MHYLKYGSVYTGVEIQRDNSYALLQLTKKKNEFVILQKKTYTDLDELIKEIFSKHIFLVFNSEKVLSKKIENGNQDEKVLLKNAFANLKIADFYFQITKMASQVMVSIARKNEVNEVITTLESQGIFVVDFSLGNATAQKLVGLSEDQIFDSSNARLTLSDSELIEIEFIQNNTQKIYPINGLDLESNYILSLGGILTQYVGEKCSSVASALEKKYLERRFFTLGLQTGLGFLLVMLLVNFMFFSSYRNKVNQLSGEVQLSQSYKTKLQQIEKQISQKKLLVDGIRSNSNKVLTKFFDELGESLPKECLLSKINFQPISNVVRKDKPLEFETGIILVDGQTRADSAFTLWVSRLENLNWTAQVEVLSYQKDRRRVGLTNFQLKIQIR